MTELPNSPDARGFHAGRTPPAEGSRALPWVLGALLLVLGTALFPASGVWLGAKAFLLEAAGILLAAYVASRGAWTRERVRAALTAPVNLAILGFLAWVALSLALSSLPQFSRFEAMLHLGGGLVYFAVAYGLTRRGLGPFVAGLAVAVSLAVLLALVQLQGSPSERPAGAFRNEQMLAGVLCLALPVLLAASQADEHAGRRLLSLAAVAVVVVGLLGARNRTAWIGAAVGLALAGVLWWTYSRPERSVFRKRLLLLPVLALAAGMGMFLALSNLGGALGERAGTLARVRDQGSYHWRLGMWSKALRMTRDRPLFGWGIGTFPINQALYYHPDAPNDSQEQILQRTQSLRENAHNSYLQLAADTGVPGLALYLAVLAAFFLTAGRSLSRLPRGFRRAVLIGAVGAVGAQAISAVSSPAWEFAECSVFFWATLGLGMAAAGLGERPSPTPTRRGVPDAQSEPRREPDAAPAAIREPAPVAGP